MHFDLLEKESKARIRKNILLCIIVCFSLLVYSLNYMNYSSTYYGKINSIEKRIDKIEKGGEEENGRLINEKSSRTRNFSKRNS